MPDFNRQLEGFFALFALVTLIIAVLLAIVGGFVLQTGNATGDSEVVLLISVVCALMAIYYRQKAAEIEAQQAH